jgi:hypothetical protein
MVAGFPPRARSGHVGFVADKVTLGQVFSEYIGFSYQFSFHLLLHSHHLSSGAAIIHQLVVDVPSGLSRTPLQENLKKIASKNIYRIHYRWRIIGKIGEIRPNYDISVQVVRKKWVWLGISEFYVNYDRRHNFIYDQWLSEVFIVNVWHMQVNVWGSVVSSQHSSVKFSAYIR